MWKVQLIISLIVVVVAYYYGRYIPFKEQVQGYDSLRNTSSIVFAVMGAWLAILYPAALPKIFGKASQAEKQIETEKLQVLFPPIIYSTVIIATVLVASLVGPILKHVVALKSFVHELRGVSFAVIGVLNVLQIFALMYIILPIFTIQIDIKGFLRKEGLKDRLHSRVSKKK